MAYAFTDWCVLERQNVLKLKTKQNCMIPFGKFGPPYLGMATSAARAALPSHTSTCWVFSFSCNSPNPDMDYRIFKVRKHYVIILMRVYTHGGWAYRQRVSTTFWFWKTPFFSCAPDRVWISGLWISSQTLYQLSHPAIDVLGFALSDK